VSRSTGVPTSVVSRLEQGSRDPRLSVIERYAAGLGYAVQYRLIPAAEADETAPIVVSTAAGAQRSPPQ
jgi:transcriptional regulator with XRE-family HTH domain